MNAGHNGGITFDKFLRVLSASTIMRYGYAGFLLALILTVAGSSIVKDLVQQTHIVIALVGIFFVGGGIYVFSRYVAGELLFYPAMHAVHCATCAGRFPGPMKFLKKWEKGYFRRRIIYSALRREFFPPDLRERFDLAHSEIHILYLTALEFGSVWIYYLTQKSRWEVSTWLLLSVCVVTLTAAFVTDIQQHHFEYRRLRYGVNLKELEKFLDTLGVKKPNGDQSRAGSNDT